MAMHTRVKLLLPHSELLDKSMVRLRSGPSLLDEVKGNLDRDAIGPDKISRYKRDAATSTCIAMHETGDPFPSLMSRSQAVQKLNSVREMALKLVAR